MFAEVLIGHPLFQGGNSVDQLVEIIKVLGTPTPEDLQALNPNYSDLNKFPPITPLPWSKIFRKLPPSASTAIDLVSRLLVYKPKCRMSAMEAMSHPFFNDLRMPDARLPSGKPLPPLFNLYESEVEQAKQSHLLDRILPSHLLAKIPADASSKVISEILAQCEKDRLAAAIDPKPSSTSV